MSVNFMFFEGKYETTPYHGAWMLSFSWVPATNYQQSVAAQISVEPGLLFKVYDISKKKVVTLKIPQDYPIPPIPSDLYLRLHAPGFPPGGTEIQFDWTYSPPSTVYPYLLPTPADYTGIALAWTVLEVQVPPKGYIITIKTLTSKQPCPLNATAWNTAEWSVKYLLASYTMAHIKIPHQWIIGHMSHMQTIPEFYKSFFKSCRDDPDRLALARVLPPLSGLTDDIAMLVEKMFGPRDQKLRRLTYGRLKRTKAELSKVDRLVKGLGRVPSGAKRLELRDAVLDALEIALVRKDETVDALSRLSVSHALDPKSAAIQALSKLDVLRRS